MKKQNQSQKYSLLWITCSPFDHNIVASWWREEFSFIFARNYLKAEAKIIHTSGKLRAGLFERIQTSHLSTTLWCFRDLKGQGCGSHYRCQRWWTEWKTSVASRTRINVLDLNIKAKSIWGCPSTLMLSWKKNQSLIRLQEIIWIKPIASDFLDKKGCLCCLAFVSRL